MGQNKQKYFPILPVKPAEMGALERLSDKERKNLLPIIKLRKWVASTRLEALNNCLERSWSKDLPYIADIDETVPPSDATLHQELTLAEYLSALKNPNDGFANWCTHVENNLQIIPCLQHSDISEIELQIKRLPKLQRGLAIRLKEPFYNLEVLIESAYKFFAQKDLIFIFDFGAVDERYLTSVSRCADFISQTFRNNSMPLVSVSATSFPHSFGDSESQLMFERSFFEAVRQVLQEYTEFEDECFVYSDYGSTRESSHWSQVPEDDAARPVVYARLDIPRTWSWNFLRNNSAVDNRLQAKEERKKNGIPEPNLFEHYIEVARQALKFLPSTPACWAHQAIMRTAVGDKLEGIKSPAAATRVRINFHLHRTIELLYPDDFSGRSIEDDWED